ncbi:hypothetical protein NXV81_29745 [Bacteroides ovatus]|nr:hypothetical protein [Bacteroides ovatus]
MPMKSNQEQLIHRISFKGISKWAKLSNTPTEQCFAIYNGDKDIKTSVGQVNGWNHFSLF